MTGISTLLVLRVRGPAAAISSDGVPRGGKNGGGGDDDRAGNLLTQIRRASASITTGAEANLLRAMRNPQIRILLALHTFYFVLLGALDLLCVVLGVDYLHMGPGGPGFLNAALGGGALLAGFVTLFLVGRRHLANTLAVTLSIAVVALALIGVVPSVTPTLLLIGTVGLAGAVFDVTGRTLLQRSTPSDAIAGSFSILEALADSGLVLGAVLVRFAIAIGGLKTALFAPAVVALMLISARWHRIQQVDASATVPQVEIQLLRAISIFAALPAPTLEGIARDLEALSVPQGTVVIKEGELGDSYYAIAEGELVVSRQSEFLRIVSRGDGFGEIALIRDVPRQATVTAATDASLYALDRELFVRAVSGHVPAASAVEKVISQHFEDDVGG
jgi:hypothetical protein